MILLIDDQLNIEALRRTGTCVTKYALRLTIANVSRPARGASARESVDEVSALAAVHARCVGALVDVDCRTQSKSLPVCGKYVKITRYWFAQLGGVYLLSQS